MSPRNNKHDNSPDLVREAGEYLYEHYYKRAKKKISFLRKFHRTTQTDILHTWFVLMLHYLRYCWDSKNETKEDFIRSWWYYATIRAWRIESFGASRPDISYAKFECPLESLRRRFDYDPVAKQDFMDFEEYEEFEQIVSGMSPRFARILRDRLYFDFSHKELAKKYNLTSHSVSTYLNEARKIYRKKYEERHERVEENLGSDCDCVRRDSDDHD